MPVFRTHTAELRGGSLSTPRATAASFGGQTAVALQGLGKQGQQLAQQMADIAERREKLEAQKRIAQFQERAIRVQDELALEGEPMSDKFREFMDAELHDILQDFQTRDARTWIQTRAPTIRSVLMRQARVRDTQLVGDLAQEQVDTWLQSNAVTLQSMPDAFPEMLVHARDLVEGLEIPDHLKPQMRRDLSAALAANAAQGWIQLDADSALQMLQDGKFDEFLEPDTRLRLIGNAKTLIRAQKQELRDQRAEFNRQKQITQNRTMIDALVALESPSDDDRLTASAIAALATQTHADGDPVLSPSQVSALFTRRRTIAEGGPTSTSPEVFVDVIPRLGTITEGELIQLASEGKIAGNDFERWIKEVQTGDSALKSTRTTALRNATRIAGIPAYSARLGTVAPRLLVKVEQTVREREKQYRESNKNPMDYYTDGTFQADVEALRQQLGEPEHRARVEARLRNLSEGREIDPRLQLGAERRHPTTGEPIFYIGGDPGSLNSYVTREALEGGGG